MDFSYLLELAKSNDKSNKKEASVSRFSTKVSKPKKLDKPAPKLSAIQAVLDKKEEHKLKENEDARKKKQNLLALRAQDRKSNKRVKAMITRNKGASKAVLDDAKDITTAIGEEQCDEDDYGYESAMSQHIFSKLANQYANMPEDERLKFVKNSGKSNIDDIKNRVINTLKKEEEDEFAPRKRKRKRKHSGDDDFINDGDEYDTLPSTSVGRSSSSGHKVVNVNLTNYKSDKHNNFKYDREKEKENSEKEKHREKRREKSKSKPAPPPMSFEELLRVAKVKHREPLPEVKEEKKEKVKKKDVGRPLTAREKDELEEERRRKLRRLGKLPPEKKDADKSKYKDQKGDPNDPDGTKKNGEKNGKKAENNSKLQQALQKPKVEPKAVDRSKYFAVPAPPKTHEAPQPPPRPSAAKTHSTAYQQDPKTIKSQKTGDIPGQDFKRPRPQKIPLKDRAREFPPSDVRRKPPVNPPPKMRIESDSEEDYDSEMDDFIDDGEEELDFSSEIRKMFGYDKRKFQDDDDDCDDMEASYSQMQKEEKISAKIGLREDLEDMQREEEEKKLKMVRLKQMKKAKR